MTIYYGGGRMQGKSWAASMHLFTNWTATNFCPLPDNDTQAVMWQAWLEGHMVMKECKEVVEEDVFWCEEA